MKFKYIALSLLLVVAAINFTRTTLEIVKSSKRLDTIKGDISLLEQEKIDLEKSIEYKKSEAFIEKTARDDLNMAKAGESVYVISGLAKNDAKTKESGSGVLSAPAQENSKIKSDVSGTNNLKLWLELLF